MYSAPMLADLDGNGCLEVVIGTSMAGPGSRALVLLPVLA